MRKSAGLALIPLLLLSSLLVTGLAGCGGGNSSTTPPRVLTDVTVAPTSISLNHTQVLQVFVRALDQDGAAMLADFTFATGNNAVFTVSNGGLVCAGTWDSLTTPVVCMPANPPLDCSTPANCTANLTVTATASGAMVSSDPVPVLVHDVVTSVLVTPAAVDCLSQDNDTGPDIFVDFSARAFSGGNDITATVGPFTWASAQSNIATITTTGAATARATGELPGVANITATVNGVVSPVAPLTICPPASISLHVNASTATSFSVAVNGTQTLAVDIVDTLGEPLEGVPVSYQIVNPNIASINSSTRVVTGSAVGTTGILAHCTPPSCNQGSTVPSYSNVVMATVTGTAAAGTVYATCSSTSAPCTTPATGGGTQTPLIPINTSTDTAGTAINLPQTPNSMLFTRDGATLFLGSANGMMIVDAGTNALQSTVSNLPGRVLAVSPDGNRIVVSNIPGASVFIFDRTANSIQVLGISDASAAAFTPDGLRAFIVAANSLFVVSTQFALQNVPLTAVANDVTVLPGGSFVYLAGGTASSITARATCRNDSLGAMDDTVGAASTPPLIASLPDGSQVLAVESPNLDAIAVTTAAGASLSGCPPTVTNTLTPHGFGMGFTPRQIIVLPNATRAYVTSDLAGILLAYEVAGGTTSTIPLIGGAQTTTGGATVSSERVYVGGSNNAVHRIDVGTATDATSIGLSFTPDLVAARPR